jgi:hypothetical protein
MSLIYQFLFTKSPNFSLIIKWMTILSVIITVLWSPKYPVSAETDASASYYVSTSGSDSNPGTLTQPWRTIAHAGTRLNAGDTLFIFGGIYQEHVWISKSGTQLNPILVTNYNNGEVIIDGINNTLPPQGSGTPLIAVAGDWVTISNLTIRYSGDRGVSALGAHVILDNLYVHHNWAGGVTLQGNYDLIQNSRIWYNSTINENGQSTTGWGSGVSCARYPDYCTIRKTTVWGNWGEGISTFEALHTTLEDNISYDNEQNFYISDTKYTLVQRNLSYCTPGNPIDPYVTQNGILVGDEKGVPIPLGPNGTRYPSSDNTFINNLVMGCNRNLAAGTNESTNNLYAYNTFVNSAGTTTEPANVLFYEGTASNARFVNNIIMQQDTLPVAVISGSGVSLANNLWSKTPPTNASGPGDVTGDPKLAKTGIFAPGQLTAGYFRILTTSPATARAMSLSEVITDYFLGFRGPHPDIGADEKNPVILTKRIYFPAVHCSSH